MPSLRLSEWLTWNAGWNCHFSHVSSLRRMCAPVARWSLKLNYCLESSRGSRKLSIFISHGEERKSFSRHFMMVSHSLNVFLSSERLYSDRENVLSSVSDEISAQKWEQEWFDILNLLWNQNSIVSGGLGVGRYVNMVNCVQKCFLFKQKSNIYCVNFKNELRNRHFLHKT